MTLYAQPGLTVRERSIRVVRLKQSDLFEGGVNLEMRVLDLNNKFSDYVGLSYMWGDPEPTHFISINGVTVGIRPNLLEFLLEMQRQNEADWFWIDALCIDQDNLDEKSEQVRMMGHIYKRVCGTCLQRPESICADEAHRRAVC